MYLMLYPVDRLEQVRMRVRLIGMALAALLTLSEGCGSSPVIYQVTVRDFLPIWCMPEVEANSLGLGDGESFNFKAGQRLGSFCPYQSYIDSGEVSGHPDFNRPVTIRALSEIG